MQGCPVEAEGAGLALQDEVDLGRRAALVAVGQKIAGVAQAVDGFAQGLVRHVDLALALGRAQGEQVDEGAELELVGRVEPSPELLHPEAVEGLLELGPEVVDEARALSELPGGVEGKIVKPDFTFGFPDFVTGDKLPEKEKLPQLQRQWADIRTMVETLQACGIVELVRIEPTLVKQPTVAEQQPKETKRKNRRKKADEEAKPAYTEERYAIDFRAKPASLVKVVNALATSQRFIVVESLDFTRESDMIGKALGEGDKRGADAEQQSSRPRRRRRGAEQAEFGADAAATDAAAEADKGVVNDPDKEEPFLAKAVVLTYDFGSAAQASGGETAGAEDAKENKEEEE